MAMAEAPAPICSLMTNRNIEARMQRRAALAAEWNTNAHDRRRIQLELDRITHALSAATDHWPKTRRP
jgi:hypothetical protein